MPATSPEFERPPLAQVALGVRFEPLSDFTAAHAGIFWGRVRDRFPRIQEQSPLELPIEQPPGVGEAPPLIQVRTMLVPPPPRSWLLNREGTELVQIQNDFFAHNWRKVSGEDSYPRYRHIREQFCQDYETLASFVIDEKLGDILPIQCELSYVNHMDTEDVGDIGSRVGDVIKPWAPEYDRLVGAPLEDVQVAVRHLIQDQDGAFAGRLHVQAQSAIRRRDAKRILVLSLVARGGPLGTGLDGVLAFLDRGHDAIVHGFVELTTDEMHKSWGYKDEH